MRAKTLTKRLDLPINHAVLRDSSIADSPSLSRRPRGRPRLLDQISQAPSESRPAPKLDQIGNKPGARVVEIETVKIAWVYKEVVNMISRYRKLVREGKDLDAALAFSTFIQWSGLLGIFKECASSNPVKIDGVFCEYLTNELAESVREIFRSGKVKPNFEMSEIEKIDHKLDLIAGYLANQHSPK